MNKFLCSSIIVVFVHLFISNALYAQPVANFSANFTTSCAPAVISFTDLSTGSPTSWDWDLGNGANATIQNPSTTYTTPGTYTVTLTVTNSSGSNTKTIANYITITPRPTVAFTSADTGLSCVPKTVQFLNQSIPNSSSGTVTYSWDFGDGGTSSSASPTHVYTTAGNYNVTLAVVNGTGCNATLTKTAYVHAAPRAAAAFTAANNSSCTTPLNVSFTNISTGASSYYWDFGDGFNSTSASPSHVYTAPGSYTVKLVAISSAGCRDTLVQPSTVNIGNLNVNFSMSPAASCIRKPVVFTNTTTPASGSVRWYFGDGDTSSLVNPVHAYMAAGTYVVKLVVTNGSCKDSVTHTVSVTGPTAQFTATNTVGCSLPHTVTFNNTATGAVSYLWLFGDGGTSTATSPTYTYTTPGTYTVRLIATNSNGCTDTMIKPNLVQIVPITGSIASGSVLLNPGCAPATIIPYANINSVIPITGYNWNFGDGNSGTGSGTVHTYTAAGTFTLVLTVTTSTGCSFSTSELITVGARIPPSYTATPTTVCLGQAVSFTNLTPGVPGINYFWRFGDGGTSNQNSPIYMYNNIGVFSPVLYSINNGCVDSFKIPNLITVNPPLAEFTTTVPCTNRHQVTFTNTSIGASTYSWDFGDGSPLFIGANPPAHNYPVNATYIVSLTVTNGGGCNHTFTKPVHIFDLNPLFNANSACSGDTTFFTGINNTHYTSYLWRFGNGASQTTTTNTISYAYPLPGIYSPRLIITDIYGCKDSMTRPNYINVNKITPAFTANITNACAAVTFTDNSSTIAPIITRTWDFGDGSTATVSSATITHTYSTPGTYTVKLWVADGLGCNDSLIKINYITITRPTASFSSIDTNICLGRPVSFTNASSGNAPLTYNWNFGDGNSSSNTNPSHLYTTPGIYTVRLITTNAFGCKDTLIRTNYVNVRTLSASFIPSDTLGFCPPLSVNFNNTSTGATTYSWDFGNGNISTSVNPSTLYTASGVYIVTLRSMNTAGCVDSFKKTIHINSSPIGTFSYSPISGCFPATITFNTTSIGASSVTYDFKNGTTFTTSAGSYNYTYPQPGLYLPVVILNRPGCNGALVGADTVRVAKIYAGFEASPDTICQGGNIAFTDTSNAAATSIISRNWAFGDGFNGTGILTTHTYAAAGTFTVRMTATGATGCKDTAYRTVVVNPVPVLNVSDKTICAGNSVSIPVTGAATYSWSPATGLSCTNCSNPTASPTATTTYTVTGTNATGCSSSKLVTVTVNPSPTALSAPNATICQGNSVVLNASGANSYNWTPATGLSCTNCTNPVATPLTTTTYTLTGTNTTGCSRSVNVTVTVNPKPTVTAGNHQICAGGSANLSANGAVSYVWSPATGLSCTNCAGPIASPSTTTTYTVTGTDTNGCTNTAQSIVTVTNLPVITVSGNTTNCRGTAALLTASGAVSYAWTPAIGLSCTNCATPAATPPVTTTYTVTGTIAAGCVGTTTVTVTVRQPPTVGPGNNVSMCAGAPVTLNGIGASTYNWTPATGLSCTNCASPSANPTATTTYTVTGTDVNGCSNTATVTVTVLPRPTITTSNQMICAGGSVTLSANGATSYLWSPGAGLSCTNCANPVASPAATTTYTVTGTAANGCTSTAQSIVTVTNLPVITVSGNTANCLGTGASLTASGAVSYAWTPATGLSCTNCANPTATPTATTTYTVTGTIATGCVGTTTVTVTVHQPPIVGAGNNVATCLGTPVTLNASGASSYTWTPATGLSCTNCASPSANPLSTTTYIVTGTNSFGCNDTGVVTVTVNPKPTVTTGNHQICAGGSATLSANGAVSYSWSPATGLSCTNCASPSASPATTTTYTVTGTDINGCTNTAQSIVNVTNLPVITVSGNTANCLGTGASLTASGAVSYAWTPTSGLSCTNCANPVATPSATTTYTVTGTIAAGCAGTTNVTVTVRQPPTVSAGSNVSMCAGTPVTLNGTGASTYSWTPATGLSCTSCANPSANPISTTTYIVTGTDAFGCTDTGVVTVIVSPRPTITSANYQICVGGSATLSSNGGVSYVWSPATGLSCTNCASPIASPAATTTYTVIGTAANGCTNTAQSVVTVTSLPVITVSGNTTNCRGTAASLTANGAVSYTWTPATDLSCTNCANPTATPAATTTYAVTGTIATGCVGTTNVTVTVHQLPIVGAGNNVTTCVGSPITLIGTGTSTYSWTPAAGLSCTNCASPSANPSATTTYTVTGTDANGCTNTANVTVTVLPRPTITTSNQMICAGGSVTLSANGATSYLWSPGAGLSCTNCANPVASPAATTTYTVTGTAANGCTSTAQSIVTVTNLPVITVSGNTANCLGTGASLTASGAVSYAWTPATGLSCTNCANPTATPISTTTYTVTGTIAAGCVGTTAVTVTVHQPPIVGAGNNVATCLGTPATLNASGASSYTWTPTTGLSCANCASPSANPPATTTYIVTGTDAFGCTDTGVVTVAILPKPVITTTGGTICAGDSVSLSANGGTGYSWSPATGLSCTSCSSPTARPIVTTVYTLTGTGPNGCTNTAQATVSVNPVPILITSGNLSICPGASTAIIASGAASYVWTPTGTLSCSNCANPIASPNQTTAYTVTGTSLAGCSRDTIITVTVRPAPVVTAGAGQSACLGMPVTLVANGASNYLWTPATGLSCTNCQSPSATPTNTTTYTVTGTDGFGCKDTSMVTITIKPLPVVIASNDTIVCKLTPVQMTVTGGISHVWSPGTGLSCTNCSNPLANPGTGITYTVTGLDTNGCSNTDQVTINQYPQPPVNAGPDQTICAGMSAQLDASGADTYLWSPAATLTCTSCFNPIATPTITTSYTVTGTDIHGCVDSDKVAITVLEHEPVHADDSAHICEGESHMLSASGGTSYTWYPPDNLSSTSIPNPIASPGTTTVYHVIIKQGTCFVDTLPVTVAVHPLPLVDAGPDQKVPGGTAAQLNATGTNIATYQWTPANNLSCVNCANPLASPPKTTKYTVHVKSDFGCAAQDDVTVAITCDGKQIWLPNTFTPNADGNNDVFYPHGRGITTIINFRIYNRWGEILFERANIPTDDISYGWNGIYKNMPLTPDVYIYTLQAQCSNGEFMEMRGDITLIR